MTIRRRNRINEQFSARLIPMLEAPAYRALSRSAHLVIARIEIELGHHGGNDNGRLPVTTEDFVAYGMHRGSVAPAIREAEALGFIRVTEHGRGGNAEYRSPNYFFLTFAHNRNSRAQPPTHDWRRIRTMRKRRRLPVRRVPTKTRERLRLASEAGASGSRSKSRPSKNRNRFGKPVPKMSVFGSENQYRKPVQKPYYAPSTKNRTTF